MVISALVSVMRKSSLFSGSIRRLHDSGIILYQHYNINKARVLRDTRVVPLHTRALPGMPWLFTLLEHLASQFVSLIFQRCDYLSHMTRSIERSPKRRGRRAARGALRSAGGLAPCNSALAAATWLSCRTSLE